MLLSEVAAAAAAKVEVEPPPRGVAFYAPPVVALDGATCR